MGRAVGPLALGLALALASGAAASDSRRAVEAFVGRLAGARVSDLTITQTLTIYHPDGRHRQSTVEQALYIKIPRRQRLEQTVEGSLEVRLTVEDRTWIRQPDGRTHEAPPSARDRVHLFTPLQRSAADLLAEWRSLGVREDVSHAIRVGGRPITVIGAGPEDRTSPAVWLDQEYGVVRVITEERLPGGVSLVDLTLSEHRPLANGFPFPHRQELYANGKLLLRVVVRRVDVDNHLPDALFDPDALRRGR